MGLATPDWRELTAFAEANGIQFEPWEYRLLKRMSGAYVSGLLTGAEALSIAPIDREAEAIREREAEK